MRVVGHHQPAFQALRCLNPDPRNSPVQNTAKKPQKSFLPAAIRVYSLAMNTTQKQFSLTGVSLNKPNAYQFHKWGSGSESVLKEWLGFFFILFAAGLIAWMVQH